MLFCKQCRRELSLRGETPDPCLGMLPGVKYACCGHGDEGYISFDNGVIIRGQFSIEAPGFIQTEPYILRTYLLNDISNTFSKIKYLVNK